MKIKLIEQIIEKDENEQKLWFIDINSGAIVIDVAKVLDENIIECGWLDQKRGLLSVVYDRWDGYEAIAIMNTNGRVLHKNIKEVEEVEGCDFYIIETDQDSSDWMCAVINSSGEYLIEPEYDSISYDFYENNFIVCPHNPLGNGSSEYRIGFDGEKVNESAS